MAAQSLGNVLVNSTTVGAQATANRPDPGARVPAAALFFQALASNTGGVFICSKNTPDLAKDVLAEVAPQGSWSVGDPGQRAGFNAADFWILPTVSGEGLRITIVA